MNNNSIGDEALEEAQKQTKSGIACDGIRQQVKQCLLESDCIKIKMKRARECVEDNDLPTNCQQLLYILHECRRNSIDPRARFRGRRGDM
uniref:Cytochrome c oxidase assembly factor 5 n=1 Tax=Meloidogyne incognita TaxID=6306 RepID=A0A914LUY3_MELIC